MSQWTQKFIEAVADLTKVRAHGAVESKSLSELDALLKNEDLHGLFKTNGYDALKFCIQNKASVQVIKKVMRYVETHGHDLLFESCAGEDMPLLLLAVEGKLSGKAFNELLPHALKSDQRWQPFINARTQHTRETALAKAALSDQGPIVNKLLNAGADPNALDVQGFSAVHHAAGNTTFLSFFKPNTTKPTRDTLTRRTTSGHTVASLVTHDNRAILNDQLERLEQETSRPPQTGAPVPRAPLGELGNFAPRFNRLKAPRTSDPRKIFSLLIMNFSFKRYPKTSIIICVFTF